MVRVITGHICSGKSWHVRHHAGRNDVVIDLDRIALALSSEEIGHHDYGEHVRSIARAVRWAAINEAVRLHRMGGWDLWIIHAYPEDRDIAMYRRVGADFLHMRADRATLEARARRERPPHVQETLRRMLAAGGID